jgi:DNA (cytosine-5)-methyltransferase 1
MSREVVAVDLFCGAGGLTCGLQRSGVRVSAGVDLDPAARYPFSWNNRSVFIEGDICKLRGETLTPLFPPGSVKILAGCAPCTAYSTLRNGRSPQSSKGWHLLDEFSRLVKEFRPEIVTMENVPKLSREPIYRRFVLRLKSLGYHVDARVVRAEEFGIPQRRRRLVLLASRMGPINVPVPRHGERIRTVRGAIGRLPRTRAGGSNARDPIHVAAGLTTGNLRRIRASRPGSTWRDWDKQLRLPCHNSIAGSRFSPVYGRMLWDAPSPTITTQAFNYGSGRFGHPSQARAISLREGAILQTFPRRYRFVKSGERVRLKTVGRLIGNAVPPKLGELIGQRIMQHIGASDGR